MDYRRSGMWHSHRITQPTQIGALDGLTILRFAKVFRTGGGMEQYLSELDRVLLERNAATVVRLYLANDEPEGAQHAMAVGKGRLIECPVRFRQNTRRTPAMGPDREGTFRSPGKRILRDHIIYSRLLYRPFFKRVLSARYPKPGRWEMVQADCHLANLHRELRVDLVIMHDIGTVDSWKVLCEAERSGLVRVYINHFCNARFNDVSIREQLDGLNGLAGVSAQEVPRWISSRFTNVSDGTDARFFDPERAAALSVVQRKPVILYPARILPVKGQADLIRAGAMLRREGIEACIVLAGRTDDSEYERALRELAVHSGLCDDVLFTGLLSPSSLRDWFAAASVMAFPTYHAEGLGRILLEAQAMRVPPVAYGIGGTPEGLRDGETGFLVGLGDVDALAQRLKLLLQDEPRRQAMGRAGRAFVLEHFSPEALASRHEQFYLHALRNARVLPTP